MSSGEPLGPQQPPTSAGWAPSHPLCPPRRQGTRPPPRSTPRTPERASSPPPWPPQPLSLCWWTPHHGPATATPSLALCRPPPPPQTWPRTPGPRGRTGLRPPPAHPLCTQVSLGPLPGGRARSHSRPVAARRCGRLPPGDPRVPSPPPAHHVPPPAEAQQSAGSGPRALAPSRWSSPPETATGQGTRGWGSAGSRKPWFLPHLGAPGKCSPQWAGEPGRPGRAHISGHTRTHARSHVPLPAGSAHLGRCLEAAVS